MVTTTTDAPAPRLTKLELHGFKSFANRQLFLFEPGITAIIGPNGSGKSNISDAVRWVLGEQSHSSLRSKKTEDVIFAGGQGKAPSGMAEVTVTFDNSTGWLPIDFTEVTITRRAYRSGENQYLINGRKVRLKDVAQLTASLGHSYTVVGQGLVDAALSQRAEERRGLFEHAADLAGLRMKAAEAARNLAETESNSARLTDLLNELEPRLKTLERAARQAREWQGVHERLLDVERWHYANVLRAARARLAAAEQDASAEIDAADSSRKRVERLTQETTAARHAHEDARLAIAQHSARLQAVSDQLRRVSHEHDLASERLIALTKRREDMAETQTGLDDQVGLITTELAAAVAEVAAVSAETETVRAAVTAMQSAAGSARQARVALENEASTLATTLSREERRLADLVRRRALLEQRQETDGAERDRAAGQTAERDQRLASLREELAALDAAEQAAAADAAEIDAAIAALSTQEEAAASDVAAARSALQEAERALGGAQSRLDALKRIAESGAGLFQGVKETLGASKAGKLTGMRGTVAELISVPAQYDTAIEVALGSHLQDIVADRWADAERAIAHLKQTGAGRATFQPLDTIRGGKATLARESAGVAGVIGIAAELITPTAPDLEVVLWALIGRTVVVEHLAAARAVLPTLTGGWSAVTLGGEIARSGGSVTGGAAVRESGVLGRERDLRELPDEIERLQAEVATRASALARAGERPSALARDRQQRESDRSALAATGKERRNQRQRLAGWIAELERDASSAAQRRASLDEQSAKLAGDLIALAAEQEALADQITTLTERHAATLKQLETDRAAAAESERLLAEEQRKLATLDERLRAERRSEASLTAQQRALGEELSLRAERAATLDGEIVAVRAQRQRLSGEIEQLTTNRAAIDAERPPLDATLQQAEATATRLESDLETARGELLEAERLRGAGGLAVERARGEIAAIRQRITDDLELLEPDDLLETEHLQPSEIEDGIGAEREIAKLKDRLRRVGYVGENVVEEYEREAERHAFLRTQLDDVVGAAAALRTLLEDLHTTMREQFEETFAKVSVAFSEMFTILFGGGTARLVLTADEEGGPGGVDIVAQPPGKRLQSLALLSGGERSLTAVALLFAILKVNPTPFCLLDEVDAALDEANVVRFREQLTQLARETQSIVITHNRGTVEVADTLYGVSMRDDGVSQVLSLRLQDAVLATS